MTTYLTPPVETDADALAEQAYDYLQSLQPAWAPADANLDTWLIQALTFIAAQIADNVSQVPTTIFRYLGASLFGLPPVDAAPAVADTTWTMRDNAGYTIPAGTQVAVAAAGDQLIPFETIEDTVVAPGATTTGAVAVVAVEAGAAGSGLGTIGGPVELLDTLDFVTAVTLSGMTTGGVDAETDDDYLARLTARLRLLAPRPILPGDFAVMAEDIAGVQRALAIDGYNPADSSTGNERMVAVAVADVLGGSVGSTIRSAVDAYLQAQREVNFVVNVIDATYTTIDVTFQVKALPGFTTSDVQARAIAAVQAYLSAATWGLPADDEHGWTDTPVVRYLEVAQVINQVAGVDYITTTGGNYDLTIRAAGGTLARTDVALTGPAALTHAGTITGTAV